MYKFTKDHNEFSKGDVIDSHENAEYLMSMGVIQEVKKEKKEVSVKGKEKK